jgi:hypothetical protein
VDAGEGGGGGCGRVGCGWNREIGLEVGVCEW